MNIFYLHKDPKICAEQHNSKHVVKMILEYAQLLSTAHRVLDGVEYTEKTKNGRSIKRWKLDFEYLDRRLYKATHINHPSAVWVRQGIGNYRWLCDLLQYLSYEYTYRYGREHKCESDNLISLLMMNEPKNIPKIYFTPPTPAMPDECKVDGNSLESYRNYYIRNKQHLANWHGKINNREAPEWFIST